MLRSTPSRLSSQTDDPYSNSQDHDIIFESPTNSEDGHSDRDGSEDEDEDISPGPSRRSTLGTVAFSTPVTPISTTPAHTHLHGRPSLVKLASNSVIPTSAKRGSMVDSRGDSIGTAGTGAIRSAVLSSEPLSSASTATRAENSKNDENKQKQSLTENHSQKQSGSSQPRKQERDRSSGLSKVFEVLNSKRSKRRNAWEECAQVCRNFDEELCNTWKEELDNLLIFAGLFSAIVTAFAIESYQWLDEDPEGPELTNELLYYIASELSNSSQSRIALPHKDPFVPSPYAVRINVLWFLSLSLSLAAASLGILCMQWLREYRRMLPYKFRGSETISIRQLRYQGLLDWKVPEIISALPVLLQLALIVFFIGLIDFLWSMSAVASIAVSIVFALLIGFVLVTSVIPTIQLSPARKHRKVPTQCPYRSPQAWFLHCSILCIAWIVHKLSGRAPILAEAINELNWVEYDIVNIMYDSKVGVGQELPGFIEGFIWIDDNYSFDRKYFQYLLSCLEDLPTDRNMALLTRLYQDQPEDLLCLDAFVGACQSGAGVGTGIDEKVLKDALYCWYLARHEKDYPELQERVLQMRMGVVDGIMKANAQVLPLPFFTLDGCIKGVEDASRERYFKFLSKSTDKPYTHALSTEVCMIIRGALLDSFDHDQSSGLPRRLKPIPTLIRTMMNSIRTGRSCNDWIETMMEVIFAQEEMLGVFAKSRIECQLENPLIDELINGIKSIHLEIGAMISLSEASMEKWNDLVKCIMGIPKSRRGTLDDRQ
ncbi:hypothetical protein AX16_002519 [Volvariella volvacea WC 439]|nr:hypothetical protein AX16_002519 [Volvariella volvacea WC 439]